MKKYILILSLLPLLWSCDTLDIDNLGSYDADKVWHDEKLARANLVHLYANTFPNWATSADAVGGQQPGIYFDDSYISISSETYKKWSYGMVRQVNEAIVSLEGGSIEETAKKVLIGESLFLRAYLYFDMLVYHGGVPYITKPQDRFKDDLFVKRNSSLECFELIIKDLDDALKLGLPERISPSAASYGRIDNTYIKAFKAKVLLQKASPQFNPKNPYGNQYWAEAHTAAKEAYEHAKAQGLKLMPNYADVWEKGGCDEEIFTRLYKYPTTTSYYEWYSRPNSLSSGSVVGTGPTWDFVKEFPMKDGKQYDDPSGKYYAKDEKTFMQVYWENRDDRFDYSVLYPGKEYPVKGQPAGNRQYTALGIGHLNDIYGTNPNSGVISDNNNTLTSFYTLKGTDLSLSKAEVGAFDNDLPIMRFAELMLIYAETANENGQLDVAIEMLKEIRKRAKIEAGNDGNYGLDVSSQVSIRNAILAERNIEFCFEGHRFWDLRRTRNLHVLSGLKKYGLESITIDRTKEQVGMEVWEIPEMDIKDAKKLADQYKLIPSDFKYLKHQLPANVNAVKQYGEMKDSYYFFPIEKKHIDANTNLIQNKDWGGAFNPTLD